MSQDDGGWNQSAAAWIASMGDQGDNGRRYVLDPALAARFELQRFTRALDVGCGEGRVCRMLAHRGIKTSGIDPTEPLIIRARELHPEGDYQLASAESLPFGNAEFDLVVSCLTLVDIPDYVAAIAEMARVLMPGGTLLVANLTEMQSAGMRGGWQHDEAGEPVHFAIDDYCDEWFEWVSWAGITIKNWHRPLSAYLQAFISHGLTLTYFDELKPIEGYVDKQGKNARVPWFNMMEWRKPA